MQETPQEIYDQRVAKGLIKADSAQAEVLSAIDYLFHQLQEMAAPQRSWRAWFSGKQEQQNQENLYIHGEVGRGKSMLMDLLVEALPEDFPMRRVHYHAFMAEVHQRLHAERQKEKQTADALKPIATHYASELRLLCLDEFQVLDIADAMILSRLFTLLLDAGLCVVTTSNRKPEDLYLSGLQRESFLPFIALVKQRFRVMDLASPIDYRMQKLRMAGVYFTPATNPDFQQLFQTLTTQPPQPATLEVLGRKIPIPFAANGVAWCRFDGLCREALGAADYAAIALQFHTVFLQGIPILTAEDRNEAKRFVTLVDSFYEHKTRLICAAAAPPEALYPAGDGSFEFQRTVSRLHEMQSEEYLAGKGNA
jgi:cell division protein ZapE